MGISLSTFRPSNRPQAETVPRSTQQSNAERTHNRSTTHPVQSKQSEDFVQPRQENATTYSSNFGLDNVGFDRPLFERAEGGGPFPNDNLTFDQQRVPENHWDSPPPPYTLTATEPSVEPNAPPQSLVRKVSLRDIQGRDINVKGVPANELPSEGYSVNYENSSRQGENPEIRLVGDSLKVHGPLGSSRSNGATIRVNGNSTIINGADGSFSFGSVTSHGNNVMSTGNFHFGRNASFGVGSTINGIPISDLVRQATQANNVALPTLSPITVRVPEELILTTGTNCRNLNVENVHGKVHLRQSTADRFMGERLHDVFLRSSGNSRSDLSDIKKLEVRSSGNSTINVNNVSNSSEVVSSGNSGVDIHNANGELEVTASGNSGIVAQGGRLTTVNANSSGNSSIRVNGEIQATPNTEATGNSSIIINGRRTQPNNNGGGSSFVFYD